MTENKEIATILNKHNRSKEEIKNNGKNTTTKKHDAIAVEDGGVTQIISKQEANKIIKQFLSDKSIHIENNIRTESRNPGMRVINELLFHAFKDIIVNNLTLWTLTDTQMPFDIDINHYVKYHNETPTIREIITASLEAKGIDHRIAVNFIIQLYTEDIENYMKSLLLDSIDLIDKIISKHEEKIDSLVVMKKSKKIKKLSLNIGLLELTKIFLTNNKNSTKHLIQVKLLGGLVKGRSAYLTELVYINNYLSSLVLKKTDKINLSNESENSTTIQKLNEEINILCFVQKLIIIEMYSN